MPTRRLTVSLTASLGELIAAHGIPDLAPHRGLTGAQERHARRARASAAFTLDSAASSYERLPTPERAVTLATAARNVARVC